VNESGINEDGSTWYRESGEELGENGYRCRWTMMGGHSQDGSSEWKETVLNIAFFSRAQHGGIYILYDSFKNNMCEVVLFQHWFSLSKDDVLY